MVIRWMVNLSEDELRTIRAAVGRGGKATRNECRIFIDRAVRKALHDAPEPKPKRMKHEKKDPSARTVVAPENEQAATIQQRDRIAAAYGHTVPSYSVRKRLREQTLAVGRTA